MRGVVAALVAVFALIAGAAFGWRWVLAPLLGYAIFRLAYGMLRGMVSGGPAAEDREPAPLDENERVLFWCEECGTELMLLVRGSNAPPRHCGEPMHERTELL